MKRTALLLLASLGVSGVPGARPAPAEKLSFRDVAAEVGIGRVLRSGGPDNLSILETLGTGCAVLDGDGDGLLDLYFPNAGTIENGAIGIGPGSAYYRQLPTGRFVDATADSGLALSEWATGATVGDIDNDGDPDLFVTCLGPNRFYRNRGDGTFEEQSEVLGLTGQELSTSATFFDYDVDGFVDLYVANYLNLDGEKRADDEAPCVRSGIRFPCPPYHFEPQQDRLFKNDGGQRFIDVTARTGVANQEGGYGLGVIAVDVDADGFPDLYVANDTTANFLWHNQGDGTFRNIALDVGVALSQNGRGQAGMGVDAAFLDGHSRPDFFVSNFSREPYAFYHPGDEGLYEIVSEESGIAVATFIPLGWGVKWSDLDNDGDLDLAVANGHIIRQVDDLRIELSYLQEIQLFRNEGTHRFVEQRNAGNAVAVKRAHRGLAIGDLDNDGRVDLVLAVKDGPPVVLHNETSGSGNWVSLRLVGTRSNRDALGSRIEVRHGHSVQIREVTRGGSYLSSSDVRVHLGLGGAEVVEEVRIRWPSGLVEQVGPLRVNRRYRIVEGTKRAEPLSDLGATEGSTRASHPSASASPHPRPPRSRAPVPGS